VNFTDRILTCADCGAPFTFSAADQAFHQEKGFTNEPRRCPDCRAAKRAERNSGGGSYGGGYGGSRQMFSVVCSQCGKDAEVPFQPSGDRPVYCSDCYRSRQGSYGGGGGGGYGGGGGRRRY
jgi:CxxC-x17-CxxC domain-containing protein